MTMADIKAFIIDLFDRIQAWLWGLINGALDKEENEAAPETTGDGLIDPIK